VIYGTFEIFTLDLLRERRFVYLGGPVIDSKSPEFSEYPFDNRIATNTGTAQHLHATIGDAEQRVGNRRFDGGAFRGT